MATKPKNIRVEGRRWFNSRFGNTYYSVVAYIDGEEVARIDYAYGYGEQYVQDMADLLEEKGYLPGRERYTSTGGGQPLWQYCRDRDIKFYYNATDVSRKKDL